jgi:hypothetical protein
MCDLHEIILTKSVSTYSSICENNIDCMGRYKYTLGGAKTMAIFLIFSVLTFRLGGRATTGSV